MKLMIAFCVVFLSITTFAQVNQVDSQGRKQGKWEKVYPGTRVYQFKGEFKDDKPVGTFYYFYESSKTKAIIKHNEGQRGRSLAFFYHEETGKTMSCGIYRNMKKDSIWANFTPSGRLSSTETYKYDKLNGEKRVYFIPEDPNDRSQIVSTIMIYKDDMLEGEYKEYFLSRRLKLKGNYANNRQTGAWEEYHINGKRAMTTRYYNGKKHGYAIAYDTDGKRLGEAFYYQGQRMEGERLQELLAEMKEKGINPYTMTTN